MRVVSACCALLLLLAAPALGGALDPNGGHIAAGDSIGFNIAQGQVVFDKSEGVLGALVPVDGATDSGWVQSANPNYPGPYSLALEFTLPLMMDLMPGGPTANGYFSGGAYSLVDLDNANEVLLSGAIVGTFGLIEGFNNVLFSYGGGGGGGGLALTVTGGSLSGYFPPEAEMFFQYWIASPADLKDFSTDHIAGGGGSISIYAVPEPTALLMLLSGGALAMLRRGKARRV